MVSTDSTVMVFCTPDTDRLVQWPVITTVLATPLTLTMLSLQATVRLSPIPEILSWPPGGGAAEIDGPGVLVAVGQGPGLNGMLGTLEGGLNVRDIVGGDTMMDRTPEICCLTNTAITTARTTVPTAMTVPTIHHTRLPEERRPAGPGNGPP
jgi:hypothetical protein